MDCPANSVVAFTTGDSSPVTSTEPMCSDRGASRRGAGNVLRGMDFVFTKREAVPMRVTHDGFVESPRYDSVDRYAVRQQGELV